MNSPVWPKPLRQGDPHAVGGFRLEGRLGGGGMGQVFLGRSPGGRPVAVKLVRPELADDPGFRRRFATEVEAARRVGGFYTAQVVEADPDADPPWLVTAYVPGPSLHQAVETHGPLPAEGIAVLGAGLAEGLRAIHACNLVHRDLKPSNVILAADGPRVIDFGITRALDGTSATASRVVVGTPAFMSPEQARGHEIGPPSDVFSLGLVLAFAATGRSPFGTGPAEAIVYRVVHDEPDLAGLPSHLTGLVRRCLAKSPGDRPEVADVLGELTDPARTTVHWLPEPVTTMIAERQVQTLTAPSPATPPDPGSGPGDGRPDRPSPPRRRFGSGRARIGVACAVLVLGLLTAFAFTGLPSFSHPQADATASSPATPTPTPTPSPTPSPSPSSTPTPSPPPSPSPTPSPTPNAVGQAFAAVREGDCFHVGDGDPSDFGLGQPNDTFKPDLVPCDAWNAYYRVTKVVPTGTECPGPPNGGSADWVHEGGPPDITLCLDRQFRAGDCVLGDGEGKLDTIHLLDGWNCSDSDTPGDEYRVQIFRILGPHQGDECGTSSVQALHGTVTLCLKVL
ncbi:serine/threonine-protein kinase [Kitasatospora phosalacinea]|uniref:serine/threonine-protein kinase n=1 Tax=Kitasatospora phosalacinea TaxID=2065 RepID=UPI00068DDD20|nr:serine/threonine-protein kinase [Kitasatospora phosalacinea]